MSRHIHVHLHDARWTGELTALTAQGRRVALTQTVEAPDSYAAGDKLKAAAARKFGELHDVVIKFNRGRRLSAESESAQAARGAGREEDALDMARPRKNLEKEDRAGIVYAGRWYSRIYSVRAVGPGKYEVTTSHGTYTVEGGKKLGGSRTDWFLESPQWSKYIAVKGLVDALNLLQSM